jgi:CDP-6-deoxy-D-xylo-4-hexulose-3-dehydrase
MSQYFYPLASTTWDHEEVEVAHKLLLANKLTMGPEVLKFESEFANFIGTKYAVMFNSGSSANLGMMAALRYMKDSPVSPGDEVIVPAVSWSTTFYPVNQVDLKLKFVDVELDTLNMSAEKVEAAITPQTRAILAVNLLGNPAELDKLKEIADKNGLVLLEDNCESLGASINGKRTGSFGLAGTHSFFFSHHICTMEGGMVTTNNKVFAETLISIRAHGWTRGLDDDNSVFPKSADPWEDLFRFVLPGYNLRPIELSGAIGQVQLRKFHGFLEERRKNAETFIQLFSGRDDVLVQREIGSSSWFGFSFILKGKLKGQRQEVLEIMQNCGIETRPIVAGNFTQNPVMHHLHFCDLPELPNSEYLHEEGFFIGNHHVDFRDNLKKVHEIFVEIAERVK